MLSVQSEIDLLSNSRTMDNSTDIMELNTKYYDNESDPNKNDVQVLASNYLTYKVGKLYLSQLSSNLLSF